MSSEQQAKQDRKREHPLAHRHPGDDVIDQVGGGLRHAPGATARAEAATLATEGHELLMATVGATQAQEAAAGRLFSDDHPAVAQPLQRAAGVRRVRQRPGYRPPLRLEEVNRIIAKYKGQIAKASSIVVRAQVQSMNQSFFQLGLGICFAVLLVYF